jgi:phosphopantetheine adenylyltransferase
LKNILSLHNNKLKTTNDMSTAELKIELIARIANTKEAHVIEELRKFLDFELEKNVYELNSLQQQRIC